MTAPRRRIPGRKNRVRLWVLAATIVAIGIHMGTWYGLGWQSYGKLSFSGFTSLAVGHINMAAAFCLALLVSLVIAGRVFCGYGCKLSALQEATEWIYRKVGYKPPLIHTRARAVRVLIWVPYLLPVLYAWREVGLSTAYVDLGAVEPWTADLPQTVLGATFYFVSITLVLTAVFGRRAFCRLVCPFALLFQPFGALPWVARIRQTGRCVDCGACDRACPMGVDVSREVLRTAAVRDPECIRCMICVDVCPVKGLGYGASVAYPPQQPDLTARGRVSAFPWRVDVGLATLAAAGGVWAATRITGFHVFLGATWGLVAGALAWMAWRRLRRAPAGETREPLAEACK